MQPESSGPVEAIRIVRVITRLNVGGPTSQAVILTEALNDGGFRACLLSGSVGPGEGDMTPEALARGSPLGRFRPCATPAA